MEVVLTKTDYILYRECAKNVWYKIHKPEIWNESELSEFEKAIIETGNEVELVARKLFLSGILIEGRGSHAQKETQKLLIGKVKVLFQPIFFRKGFFAAVDILELRSDGFYNIYEIKSTTDVDKKTHYHDLAFQVNLLERFGLKIKKAHIIHLNSAYVREGGLEIIKLFKIVDVTQEVVDIKEGVMVEMETVLKYILQVEEPKGYCSCVYKGRSNHCSTFTYSNPKIPEYGVHDISRIGASRGKLQELIDVGIFELKNVPEGIFNKLSLPQKNQIEAYVFDRILKDKQKIDEELNTLVFPLYFLDYETFPAAIPRFDGFSPYQQIPFQYSLHALEELGSHELRHFEFLHTESTDPSLALLKSLQENIGNFGSIIVWNKKFECKINEELAIHNPDFALFIKEVNARVYDLMDIFGNQYYVHKDFRGKVSIKNVLPVLVPELSYKNLEIQEGGTASQKWNEAVNGSIAPKGKQRVLDNLKEYCKFDTLAMVKIWEYLYQLVN